MVTHRTASADEEEPSRHLARERCDLAESLPSRAGLINSVSLQNLINEATRACEDCVRTSDEDDSVEHDDDECQEDIKLGQRISRQRDSALLESSAYDNENVTTHRRISRGRMDREDFLLIREAAPATDEAVAGAQAQDGPRHDVQLAQRRISRTREDKAVEFMQDGTPVGGAEQAPAADAVSDPLPGNGASNAAFMDDENVHDVALTRRRISRARANHAVLLARMAETGASPVTRRPATRKISRERLDRETFLLEVQGLSCGICDTGRKENLPLTVRRERPQ